MKPRDQKPPPASSSPDAHVSPARRSAFDILLELRRNPASHSDRLLRDASVDVLTPRDRNLATALVMGVLRWGIEIDRRIQQLRGPVKQQEPLDDVVEVAIELGALQLWQFDRIPAHAAIFESVELVKIAGFPHAAGLVNAILRKLQRMPWHAEAADASGFDSAAAVARRWAHPRWLVERWSSFYGLKTAAAICGYNQQQPPIALRLLADAAEAALPADGVIVSSGQLVDRARIVRKGDVLGSSAWRSGLVRIQDEGSQLIGELAAARDGNMTMLDCCAAPGGKLAILAERNPAAEILALDIHPGRLEAMRRRLGSTPFGSRITYRRMDAALLDGKQRFDRILLDAPCSGTGTLARNPEIRYRLGPEDFDRYQQRQKVLLTAAMRALSVGGRLLYSTCSLELEENDQVVEAVLRQQKNFRLESAIDAVRALEEEAILAPGATAELFRPGSNGDYLRTFPGLSSCDGFFAAILTRLH